MSAVAILAVVKNASGAWEAIVPVVHGSDDVTTRDSLDGLAHERARVLVQGEERELTVYCVEEDDAFVVWDEALPP